MGETDTNSNGEHQPPQDKSGVDWSLTTYTGNRKQQHQEFLRLPLRVKLERLEQMAEVGRLFSGKVPESK